MDSVFIETWTSLRDSQPSIESAFPADLESGYRFVNAPDLDSPEGRVNHRAKRKPRPHCLIEKLGARELELTPQDVCALKVAAEQIPALSRASASHDRDVTMWTRPSWPGIELSTERKTVTIWVVRVGDGVFVRAYQAVWFQQAQPGSRPYRRRGQVHELPLARPTPPCRTPSLRRATGGEQPVGRETVTE